MPRQECRVCEAPLQTDGTCSNQDCSSHPCLQCGQHKCDCPPLTDQQKMNLRAEKERQELNQGIARAANEKLFPVKPEIDSKAFRADMTKRPKVTFSERRARSEAQFEKKVRPRDN